MTTQLPISIRVAQHAALVLAELIYQGNGADLGELYLIDLRGAEANLRRVLLDHAESDEDDARDADGVALVTVNARTIARAKEAFETMIIVATQAAPEDIAAAADDLAAAQQIVDDFAAQLADVPIEEIIYVPELEQAFAAIKRPNGTGWDPGSQRPDPFQFYCPPKAMPRDGMIDLPSVTLRRDESGGSV